MPNLRAQIPIYPRPVSPLQVESISEEDCSSGEDAATERAAKRRRIEKCGQQYLRGEGLFILSAGLRGPFGGAKWTNPWSKAMSVGVLEVPETTGRGDGRRTKVPEGKLGHSAIDIFARRTDRSEQPAGGSSVPRGIKEIQSEELPSKDPRVEDWLKTSNAYQRNIDDQRAVSPTPFAPNRHIRTTRPSSTNNNVVPAEDTGSRSLKTLERAPTPSLSKYTPADTRSKISNNADRPAQTHLDTMISRTVEPTNPRDENVPLLSENMQRAEYAILKAKRKSVHTVPFSTNLPAFEYRRAGHEGNPCHPKRQQVSNEVITTEQSRDQPEVLPVPIKPEHGQAAPVIEQMGVDVSGEASHNDVKPVLPQTSPHYPAHSMETSGTGTTNLLPSAQINPGLPLQPSITIQSNGDRMIEEQPRTETAEVVLEGVSIADAGAAAGHPSDVVSPAQIPKQQATSPPNRDGDEVTSTTPRPAMAPSHTNHRSKDLNTQQMLAAMTPLNFSTVKKVPLKAAQTQKSSPVTATKRKAPPAQDNVRSKKSAKRASFAPEVLSISSESSQGSLKASLKVSKRPVEAMVMKGAGQGRPSLFGKLGLDMETSDDDDEVEPEEGDGLKQNNSVSDDLPGMSSLLGIKSRSQPLKSALKSSAPAPTFSANPFTLAQSSASRASAAAPKASTTSSNQQDAQLRTPFPLASALNDGQNGLSSIRLSSAPHVGAAAAADDDGGFDLKGAIDDLGSYLGTWDPDKEASGLFTNR